MTTRLVIGFVPLLDCAPLVAAVERGFAADEGLELQLEREASWATVRDRLAVGHFAAAHLLGPMTIAASIGIGQLQVPLIAPLALGLGGNAVTVSLSLWAALERHGATHGADPATQGAALREVVAERARGGAAPLTLATVYPFSAHNYELRYWLAACGIDPDEDVTLVVIPPPYMVEALRAGQIDGYCAGEPWNSLAVAGGVGAIVTATTAIWPRSPEKVLGLRTDWAERHPGETAALVRAVHRAAGWCDQPGSHAELAQLLARPHYVGEAAQLMLPVLGDELRLAPGAAPHAAPEFLMFARHGATLPRTDHALWFYSQMVRWKQLRASPAAEHAARTAYRPDLWRSALEPAGLDRGGRDAEPEGAGFFDHIPFDPRDLTRYLDSLRAAR